MVEILKRYQPRSYRRHRGTLDRPHKGDLFLLNDNEILYVSTLPPMKSGTPQPIQIRLVEGISVNEAIASVYYLTLIHHGSVRAPKHPITIHYSDKIAGFAMKGIMPKNLEGSIPYWL
ncbi:MAG: hypothetical protein IH840_16385 [Candidatus Heimdallarchaeota archaeon]|nr:hypothetical protein [Candidatus Heimdallarchaeota archaeon]